VQDVSPPPVLEVSVEAIREAADGGESPILQTPDTPVFPDEPLEEGEEEEAYTPITPQKRQHEDSESDGGSENSFQGETSQAY
jgi:hypothetical protein